MDTTDMYRFSS